MDPLNDQDPISKLLAQARQVEPRGNFTQNVLREARQTPQERGLFATLASLFSGSSRSAPALRLAAATAAIALIGLAWMQQSRTSTPSVVEAQQIEEAPLVASTPVEAPPSNEDLFADEIPLLPEVETQWQNLDHQDALLAVEDTSMLSDSEVAFFLY